MSLLIAIFFTITSMIFANALYVAAEFDSVRARKTRITQMADSGNWLARMLLPYLKDRETLDNYIAACQIGITLSSLVLGAYSQNTVAVALAPLLVSLGNMAEPAAFSISATVMLIILTILQVIIGEVVPKAIAIQYPEKIALLTVVPMRWSLVFFSPLIWLFNGSGRLIFKLMGLANGDEHSHIHSPEEIELLVRESHLGGLLDVQEQQMLRNALHLHELVARQVMIPRVRLVAAPVEATVDQLLEKACEAGFTRIPLYESTIDNIVGFVHIKDLFRLQLQKQQDPQQVLRKIEYVPETLPVIELWNLLSQQRQYIAIVFDEYGGTVGLVTFEDLIEEIFGELQDEFDEEVPLISSDKEGRIHLRADLLVTDVNHYLDLDLPEDMADTLGGLIFQELERLPAAGDEVMVGASKTRVRVETMDGRAVTEVSLLLPKAEVPHVEEWEMARHD
jgi:CBS domain containing-hemolysin-like protein